MTLTKWEMTTLGRLLGKLMSPEAPTQSKRTTATASSPPWEAPKRTARRSTPTKSASGMKAANGGTYANPGLAAYWARKRAEKQGGGSTAAH